MPIDPALRTLDVTLPACPPALARLSALLADEHSSPAEVAEVVESDLALAAAVMRTVNSAMFGLLRRVETVGEAVRFLGLREVAAITIESVLRQSFPAHPLAQALWERARWRGLLMGRVAAGLQLHAWRAQSLGLFAEAGQAVLLAHAPSRYLALRARLPAALSLGLQIKAERQEYGIDHAVLGAALCRAWGLAAEVADAVHERPWSQRLQPPRSPSLQALLCLLDGAQAQIDGLDALPVLLQTSAAAGLSADQVAAKLQQVWAALQTGQPKAQRDVA